MAHDATHAPKDDGAVHTHISSAGFYTVIFLALICLTILTVGQSYVDLGKMNLIVVILIATTKASLVVSFFMHLRYDNKFHALIFVCSLMFIGVFFAYTINDTGHRGQVDLENGTEFLPADGAQAPGGMPSAAPAKHESEHGAQVGGPLPEGEHGGGEAPATGQH